MATNTSLQPMRDYDEHETINLFGVSGAVVTKGTFVVTQGSGLNLLDPMTLDDNSWLDSVLSARFNVPNNTIPAPSGTLAANVLGMTLKTIQTVDENGMPLKFLPEKAALLDVIISGQACPIIDRGLFWYSGVSTGAGFSAQPAAGTGLGVSDAGDGSLQVVPSYTSVSGVQVANAAIVANCIGPINQLGFVPIRVRL